MSNSISGSHLADTRILSLMLAAVFCLAGGPLRAALPEAKSTLDLELTGRMVEFSRDGPLKESISNSHVTEGAEWAGVSAGETGSKGGRRFSSARASNVSLGTSESSNFGMAISRSTLEYELMIVQVAPPPVPLAGFPANVAIRTEVSASASGDESNNSAFALARVFVAANVTMEITAFVTTGSDARTVAQDFDLFVVPGQLFDVRLFSAVVTFSGATLAEPAGTAVAFALADPVFSFDQTAFEEMALAQGFAPFDLSAYFAFEESPFAAPIPEPSSALMMLAGTLLVAGAYRRRRPRARSSGGDRS